MGSEIDDEEHIKALIAVIEEEKEKNNLRLVHQLEGHLEDAYKNILSSRANHLASCHSIAKRQRIDEDEENVENEKDVVGYL